MNWLFAFMEFFGIAAAVAFGLLFTLCLLSANGKDDEYHG